MERFFQPEEEMDRDEMTKDLLKCDRRLRRCRLELATLDHETSSSQKSSLQMTLTLAQEETEVRDKIRSSVVVEREAEKYSGWVSRMNDQVVAVAEILERESIRTLISFHCKKSYYQPLMHLKFDYYILGFHLGSDPIKNFSMS